MCVFRYIREMVLKSANMLRKSRICEKIWDEPTCCEQPSTARWRATFTKNRFASTRCEQPWGPTGSVHHFTKTIKSCKILPDLPKPARCAHNLTRCFFSNVHKVLHTPDLANSSKIRRRSAHLAQSGRCVQNLAENTEKQLMCPDLSDRSKIPPDLQRRSKYVQNHVPMFGSCSQHVAFERDVGVLRAALGVQVRSGVSSPHYKIVYTMRHAAGELGKTGLLRPSVRPGNLQTLRICRHRQHKSTSPANACKNTFCCDRPPCI